MKKALFLVAILAVLCPSIMAGVILGNYFHAGASGGVVVATQVTTAKTVLVTITSNNDSPTNSSRVQIQDRSGGCSGLVPVTDPTLVADVTSVIPVNLEYNLQLNNGLCVVAINGSSTVVYH